MPDQADSHLILASVLVKQKDTAGAAQERKVAADLMRQHMDLQRAEVATNSGKSLLQSGRLDDAIVQFRDALTFDPKLRGGPCKAGRSAGKAGKDRRSGGRAGGGGEVEPGVAVSRLGTPPLGGCVGVYIRRCIGLYFHWHSRRSSLFPVRIAGARTWR